MRRRTGSTSSLSAMFKPIITGNRAGGCEIFSTRTERSTTFIHKKAHDEARIDGITRQ
jgi:hypothetical protein